MSYTGNTFVGQPTKPTSYAKILVDNWNFGTFLFKNERKQHKMPLKDQICTWNCHYSSFCNHKTKSRWTNLRKSRGKQHAGPLTNIHGIPVLLNCSTNYSGHYYNTADFMPDWSSCTGYSTTTLPFHFQITSSCLKLHVHVISLLDLIT